LDNFLRRTLTGAGIVLFILGGFWLHPLSFFLTGLILVAGLLYEYFRITRPSVKISRSMPGIIAGISSYILSSLVAAGYIEQQWLLVIILFTSFILISELYGTEPRPFDNIANSVFSLIYIVFPLSLFPFSAYFDEGLSTVINGNTDFSPGMVIGFFLLVWANDTGAYLTGISIGRHKLFERVSPKKTWEGFFGGMIIAVAAAWFLAPWLGITGRTGWVLVAVIVSVAGTYGDLVESMLKRSYGVKDSGSILPGHGGFLDRFDSTIMAFPSVYLFISIFA
jgi:phosphatidate cytidylyltransferase